MSNLNLNDPKIAAKKSTVHEKARQQQNYENMRKMLAKKKTSEPTLSSDPFSVDDVGKRFSMLKA